MQKSKIRGRRRGFTLVEALVASAMAAAFMTAAALTYAAITHDQNAQHTYGEVTVGAANLSNFFGVSAPVDGTGAVKAERSLPWAPNYAKGAELEELRDIFYEDVSSASAVFCLPRTGLNTFKRKFVFLQPDIDARSIDTPEAFFSVMNLSTNAPGVFTSYRNVPPANAKNGTVFIVEPSAIPAVLWVRAMYDIDFVTTTSPAGTYVAIRRFDAAAVTVPYEAFYPVGAGTQEFSPLFVAFERRGRRVNAETPADTFKWAANRPFYSIWWPDPVDRHLEPMPNGTVSYYSVDLRSNYANMSGRTAYQMIVPMFPAL